jgi:hypothetical protein
MKNFQVVFSSLKTKEHKIKNTIQNSFPSAASWAYVEKRCLWERTGMEWEIVSICNVEFNILEITAT